MKSKLVGFLGAPSTGKTTLAGAMKEYAYINGKISTDLCTEYAREFVFKYGLPKEAYTQYRITSKQIEKEDILMKGTSEYVFTDSPVWLGYIYAILNSRCDNNLEVQSAISDMYGRFIIEQMHRYHKVFYVTTDEPEDDGCRDLDLNGTIAHIIEGFVRTHEHLLPIVRVPAEHNDPLSRKKFVWDILMEEKK